MERDKIIAAIRHGRDAYCHPPARTVLTWLFHHAEYPAIIPDTGQPIARMEIRLPVDCLNQPVPYGNSLVDVELRNPSDPNR